MNVIQPPDFFRRLDGRNVEIDDDWFLAASNQHALERLIRAGVDFLMGNKRRHVYEIARACFGSELEVIAPTHASFASYDVDHAFKLAVMMRPGLSIWMNADGSSPELVRACSGVSDGGSAIHAGCLRRVGIELVGVNDANAIFFPIT